MSNLVPVIYIDPVAGASGDMFLGALVDAGVDFARLEDALRSLKVPGFRLERREVFHHQIAGTKVDVIVDDVPHPHRHLADLLAIVDASPLSAKVKERSAAILTRLAEAESSVHRMPVQDVTLHEVGALDTLADVVGTCIGLEELGIDRIYCGPVSVGTGVIACAHGKMPEPAPGTLALLKGFPIRKTSINGELTTPTGAAIITGLATGFIEPLILIPKRVGYGAGSIRRREIANFLRIVIGETDRKLLPEHHHAAELEADHSHSHDDHGHHHHGHEHAHGH